MAEHQAEPLICSECGCVYELPDIPDKDKYSKSSLCPSCWNERCEVCAYCHNAYVDTAPIHAEGYSICPNCADAHTIVCEKCGILARKERYDRQLDGLCYNCETLKLYHDYLDDRNFSSQRFVRISYDELKKANSTLLMSRLRHSYGETPADVNKSPYDVLCLRVYNTILIIIYVAPKRLIEASCGCCTMTEFRAKRFWEWLDYFSERESREISISDKYSINAWIHPYRLCAMTVSDKHYYKIFEGGEIVEEGNEYGDTSSFLIIGTLIQH